jgi:acyl-CoA synthetase (AMP-forming)/AMP-acid ligase II/acyl carrier protein
MDSIARSIDVWAARQPDEPVILGRGDAPLSWNALSRLVGGAGVVLHRHGIGRNARVAFALPNGREAALTFLATAAWTTCAPLNPAYSESELDFFLADLKPSAMIVAAGDASPAASVAARLGIPVLTDADLCREDGGNGERGEPAAGDDVALVLHTSGTTSRPKLVPLTQHNLLSSARSIAATLELSPEDRALNVMPLFHIHGLIGVLLSSVVSGGSVVCLPRFDSGDFFAALQEMTPTWYSAVPTIHQAVIDAAHRASPVAHRLRFIRSSSSALPPQVMAALEHAFGVPVVEAYGMTEASHQMASNPLPPRSRKPASVGLPAGPQIVILDQSGAELERGMPGEIAIRGESVTRGYDENPEANEKSFTGGWFRTGDEGYFDEEGYLFLTGRLKEMINRGGEKIAPVEIDRVMLDHPAVAQAVAFAIPHPRLGEDIGVAIVLREGVATTASELRSFASSRLTTFKVPSVFTIVDAIPKGATGKQQRIGLAEKLGVGTRSSGDSAKPESPLQKRIAAVWSELLQCEEPYLGDNFFMSGGDSIVSVQLLSRLEQIFGVELSLEQFFDSPTPGDLALMVEKRLVERIASLTDEEAAALLRKQEP